MKILVAIASYGTRNDAYLQRLIDEYSSMRYEVDIVVHSNIRKSMPSHVELVVGLPSKNPWSLPFAHKKTFVERRDSYDLYIYTEDDTLITERHIDAFLKATTILQSDEIAGFLRSEVGPDGAIYYSSVHRYLHWDPHSVCRRGDDTFAFFTNEHGACYLLTREQLGHCIESGGFDVPPHEGKYDLLVSAATDPYTQCGLRKLVCISRLEEFTCQHLTNKYVGVTGVGKPLVDIQVRALLELAERTDPVPRPVRVETKLAGQRWAKSYYEPCRKDLIDLLPPGTNRVLSLGCGWGATEEGMLMRGIDVTAVPLDIIIGRVAESKGVRVLPLELRMAAEEVAPEHYDAILISGLLHLIEDPVTLMRRFRRSLRHNGAMVANCPNVANVAVRFRRMRGGTDLRKLAQFKESGMHVTSGAVLQQWFTRAGFDVARVQSTVDDRWRLLDRMTGGIARNLLGSECSIVARKSA